MLNDDAYREFPKTFFVPVFIVGLVVSKIIIAGSLVSALFLSILVNPVTKPSQMLEYLWIVPIIAVVVILWWLAGNILFTRKT
jgi:ABC-type sugar transport system permease subunit